MQSVIEEEKLHFKAACSSDALVLSKLGKETFTESYGHENTAENMSKYIKQAFSKKAIISQLEDDINFFLIVKLGNKAVGYAKLRENNNPFHNKKVNAVELERIYVKKEFQGNGIGQALLDKCLAFARLRKHPVMWLGVWEKNLKALKFYQKLGFVVFGSHLFELGNEEQNDYLMKIDI